MLVYQRHIIPKPECKLMLITSLGNVTHSKYFCFSAIVLKTPLKKKREW